MLQMNKKAKTQKNMEEIDLVEYLLSIGEPLERDGRNYFRHREHDSLVISRRKNAFYWNSRETGGGPIQYLQAVHGLSYQAARTKFLSDINDKNMQKISVAAKPYADKFEYHEIESDLTLDAKKYLVVERKIGNKQVNELIRRGLLAEEKKYHNIVFKWFKGDQFVGYSKQGTQPLTAKEKKYLHTDRKYIKRVAPTTKEFTDWGFNIQFGQPQNLYFFESPIDALSYWTLNPDLKNSWLISTDGGNMKKIVSFIDYAVEQLKAKKLSLKKVSLAFDQDATGEDYWNTVMRLYDGTELKFSDCRPTPLSGQDKTDWNDVLKAKVKS